MRQNRRGFGRRTALLAISAVAAGATLVGFGSTSSAKTPKFRGAPLTVAINTPVAAVYGNFPGSVAAVKAAARAINAAGGINGRQVKVVSCKTQGDPNLEVGCARTSVSAGAVATINSFIVSNPNGYLQVLANAHTADIGSEIVTPQFAQASNVFPLTFGFGAFAACTGKAMAKQAGGNRVTTFIAEIAAAKPLESLMQLGATAQGNVWAGSVGTPATVTDWSPIVQQVASLSPNVVIPGGGPQQYAPFVSTAVSTGHNWSYCAFASGNLSKLLAPLGSEAKSFYDGNALPTLGSANKIPALKTFEAQMAAEVASGDSAAKVTGLNFDWEMLQAWLAMQVFAHVAKSMHGKITPSSFLKAMNTAKFSGMGIVAPLNFAKPQTYATYTRVFNPYTQLERWNPKTDVFDVVPNSKVNGAKILFGPAK